jgi:hypothetical protein
MYFRYFVLSFFFSFFLSFFLSFLSFLSFFLVGAYSNHCARSVVKLCIVKHADLNAYSIHTRPLEVNPPSYPNMDLICIVVLLLRPYNDVNTLRACRNERVQ